MKSNVVIRPKGGSNPAVGLSRVPWPDQHTEDESQLVTAIGPVCALGDHLR